MGIIFATRHKLVFPDGLVQDLEYPPPEAREGDLLSSEQVGTSAAPDGKFLITRIEDSDPGEYPHDRYYYLEPFSRP